MNTCRDLVQGLVRTGFVDKGVRVRCREVRLQFEFPKLYRLKSSLKVVDGLGKLGWQVAAESRDG